MAAGRMVLLALSVALFAAMWSGDRSAGNGTAAVAQSSLMLRDARTVSHTQILSSTDDVISPTVMLLEERWQHALPMGVAAGEYLLAEATGQSHRVMISAELLQTLGQDPDVWGEPIYPLESAGAQAYLIRITPRAEALRIAERVRE